ncbi:RNA methyltransferase [Synechococcus sp. CBW1107]|uniref:RNA methyltransferase n=1 Tax=Synechococcus sp. CBW1107 TaxID=2789857 RepID=UPI002AD1F25B|nr:RNA methyltransferase [Synechococcus sp. CBW1107]
MALPEQLLLSDLLQRRVRCDQGLDHGPGLIGWMHPPVHRLLGWVTRPSAFGNQRLVWRLNQLRGLGEGEAFVQGEPAETDPATLQRLPTLFDAALLDRDGQSLGSVVDAAVELRSGRIRHYLIARSDPRLPGSSRWRLTPERIVDQQPGVVRTALGSLDELPLARASVRQELLRRSRRWKEQLEQETGRWRDQIDQVGDRFEGRLEGWLEEPPWEPQGRWREDPEDPLEPRPEREAWDQWESDSDPDEALPRSQPRSRRHPGADADPWV